MTAKHLQPCTIEGCEKRATGGRGWCPMHWRERVAGRAPTTRREPAPRTNREGRLMLRPEIVEPLPAHLTTYDADPTLVRDDYMRIVRHAIEHHPRSLQQAIGPSEIGHPCARRIGYKMLDTDENPRETPWKPTVGTAVHAWLEEVFTQANAGGETRWLTEMSVVCGELGGQPLTGHCDLYDRVTGTVIDHKCVGPTQLKKYRSKGPGLQYQRQAHLYGRGWVGRGQHVERVAVMFLPRDGALKDAYYWHEPYDEQIAVEALQRADGILTATRSLGTDALAILPTADAFCSMCPFYRAGSTDLSNGCPGDPASQRTQAPALTLG